MAEVYTALQTGVVDGMEMPLSTFQSAKLYEEPCAHAGIPVGGRALRGVADRIGGIACVLLQRRKLFNPQHGMTATTA
jgi:hypothetical protein